MGLSANVIRRLLEGLMASLIVGGLLVSYGASGLPRTDHLFTTPERGRVAVYDASGALVAHRGLTYSGDVTLEALEPEVPQAFLAIEDHRFYSHFGLDMPGLARAFWANVMAARVVQGGSTITQQLAKNLFLSHERTLRRKWQEAVLALWLEARLTKDEILTLYLNRVYFGAGTHGIDAASRRYFGKPARAIGLAEAAVLAGLLKAPSRFAPTSNAGLARDRAAIVLKRMEEVGFITRERRLALSVRPPGFQRGAASDAHYFVDWVVDLLPRYVGRSREPLVVRTTLDLSMQREAQNAVESVLDGEGRDRGAGQAALVALDGSGAVRAMVGGRSYDRGPFNRAVHARRQPGSAFKPFVYLAALEKGLRPTDYIDDRPVQIGNWQPRNFTGRYEGPVPLSRALSGSLNAATVRLTEKIGRKSVIRTAERLGLDANLRPLPSLPLGTMEVSLLGLSRAYVPFSNGGRAVIINPIIRIQTEGGSVLYDREDGDLGQAVEPRRLDAFNAMMRRTVEQGTGRAAQLEGVEVAGKTGTSQNYRDAWFIGYGGGLTAGVWVGNDDGAAMERVTGGTLPAMIWQRFAGRALPRARALRRIPLPSGVMAGARAGAPLVPLKLDLAR